MFRRAQAVLETTSTPSTWCTSCDCGTDVSVRNHHSIIMSLVVLHDCYRIFMADVCARVGQVNWVHVQVQSIVSKFSR